MDQDQDEDDFLLELEEIPPELHSLEFDGPFTLCTQCKCELEKDSRPYQLQKVMKRGEPIIEFALCEQCHEELIRSFSETTKERLEAYFMEHARDDFAIDACIFCGIPKRELEEYNLAGHCIFDRMIMGSCVCLDCLLKIQPLISKQTRDSRDRFMERNFPGVPSDARRPVMI